MPELDSFLLPDEKIAPDQLWPIGAVTQRTGINEHTLRAWEKRFGFPRPVRLGSGHRRYTGEQVRRILRIRAALERGHRAGEVVPLDVERLEALLKSSGVPVASPPASSIDDWLKETLDLARRFEALHLAVALHRESSILGIPRFLSERVAPLIRVIGEEWEHDRIGVRHEHLVSMLVEDHVRALRRPLELSASGRPVILATLPGEQHVLGMQMAALAIVLRGRAVRVLGANTPIAEIISSAAVFSPAAVGLSISMSSPVAETVQAVRQLRSELPQPIQLWLGGEGADRLPVSDLESVRIVTTVADVPSLLEDLTLRAS